MVEGQSECMILRFVPSGSDTYYQAAVAYLVNGGGHFRQYCGVAEGVACDESADLDASCRFGQCRQHGPALPDSTGRFTGIPVEEMVRQPDTVETVLLGLLGDRANRFIGTLLVRFSIVRNEDQQPNLHSFIPRDNC